MHCSDDFYLQRVAAFHSENYPFHLRGSGPPSNTWFVWPNESPPQNGILIGEQQTDRASDWPTDQPRNSVLSNGPLSLDAKRTNHIHLSRGYWRQRARVKAVQCPLTQESLDKERMQLLPIFRWLGLVLWCPSMFVCCWLGDRNDVHPVKKLCKLSLKFSFRQLEKSELRWQFASADLLGNRDVKESRQRLEFLSWSQEMSL